MKKYRDLVKKARKASDENRYEDAISYYQEAFSTKAEIEDMLQLGVLYLETKRYYQALDLFSEIIDHVPMDPRAYYGKGIVYEEMNQPLDAVTCYTQAIEQEPSFAEVYFRLACIYEDIKEDDKAVAMYEEGLKHDPSHYWMHLNLGSHYEKRGNNTKALEHFLKAYEINPQGKMISYNLGVIFVKLNEIDKARNHYEQELTQPNPYKDVFLNLGLLYKDRYKQLEKAKQTYLEGIKCHPEEWILWYNLGCIYALQEDDNNAFQCFSYAIHQKKDVKTHMENDSELTRFCKTTFFQKL